MERSIHLIDKNLFSIKQYQFPPPPPKIGLNLFKESHRSSPLCVRRRLRLYIYPSWPEVMVGCDREWRGYSQVCGQQGQNLTMAISPIKMFSSAAAGVMNTVSVFQWLSGKDEEKMDPNKSVVFGYDGVPAHLVLAIPAQYVHNLCFPTRHCWKGFTIVWKRPQRPTFRVRKFKDV